MSAAFPVHRVEPQRGPRAPALPPGSRRSRRDRARHRRVRGSISGSWGSGSRRTRRRSSRRPRSRPPGRRRRWRRRRRRMPPTSGPQTARGRRRRAEAPGRWAVPPGRARRRALPGRAAGARPPSVASVERFRSCGYGPPGAVRRSPRSVLVPRCRRVGGPGSGRSRAGSQPCWRTTCCRRRRPWPGPDRVRPASTSRRWRPSRPLRRHCRRERRRWAPCRLACRWLGLTPGSVHLW